MCFIVLVRHEYVPCGTAVPNSPYCQPPVTDTWKWSTEVIVPGNVNARHCPSRQSRVLSGSYWLGVQGVLFPAWPTSTRPAFCIVTSYAESREVCRWKRCPPDGMVSLYRRRTLYTVWRSCLGPSRSVGSQKIGSVRTTAHPNAPIPITFHAAAVRGHN